VPLEKKSGSDAAEEPRRSQIAPVKSSAPQPETVGDLLKGLGSKTAAAALNSAAVLEKLPAPQRTALKQALRAATEAHTEVETIRTELNQVKGRLQVAEKDLVDKTRALVIQTAHENDQVAGLTKDLEAAAVVSHASESRSQHRAIFIWLAFGTALLAITACAFLFLHPAPAHVSRHKVPELAVRPPPAVMAPVPPDQSSAQQSTEAAFDRLDRALQGVPPREIERALDAANRWLVSSGSPPCTVKFDGSKVSLLITPEGKGNGPIAASLERCTQAVQHVIE
jgi:uncharacterized membrane protein